MAYSVLTDGLSELERPALDAHIASGTWRPGHQPAEVPVRSLEDELAVWGESPEAEAGLMAFLAGTPIATAT